MQIYAAFDCPSDQSAYARRNAVRAPPIGISETERVVVNVGVAIPALRKLKDFTFKCGINSSEPSLR